MEKTYVHDTYEAIARHFDRTRWSCWQGVSAFVKGLPTASMVADIGCGNGKYQRLRNDLAWFANDTCLPLLEIAKRAPCLHSDYLVSNAKNLPYREDSMDAAISVAVLHHVALLADRTRFLKEMVRVLKPGGRGMFTVWADDRRKRKWQSLGSAGDYLVPWTDESGKVYQRYYHLFTKQEIEDILATSGVQVDSVDSERDNWCIVFTKPSRV